MTYVLGVLAGINALLAVLLWFCGKLGMPGWKRDVAISAGAAVLCTVLAFL